MSQKNAKFIPMQDSKWVVFTWGIIDNSEPNVIPYQNTPYARNFRVNAGGISVRPWYYTFSSLSGTGVEPFWITSYTRWGWATSYILVGYKHSATEYLTLVDSTWAQSYVTTNADITSESRMNFLPANDFVYCMNGADTYWKLSGTTYTIPASGIANFKPSFGVFFNNCWWVSGNPNAPTKLYKSVSNNLDDYSSTGSDSFTSPYPIKWLGVNQQSLYVFTQYGIDVFNTNSINQVGGTIVYQSKPLEATEWCTNHNLIVSIGKGIFYISPSNKIRKINPTSFGMYDFTELSHRAWNGITKTMESLDSDQSEWFGFAIPEKQLICWHLKTKGATYNDIVITYNYEFDEWMVDTNKSFSGGTLFNSKPYTISTINPTVFRDEEGSTDDDAPIQFRYDTKWIDLWEPTILKCLWQTRTFLKLNVLWEIYQNIYADWSLIDSKLINQSAIPQSSAWLGTSSIWTYSIGTEWAWDWVDTLYNTVIVRDKWYLRVKAKTFYVSYVSGKSWTQCLIQKLEPQMEQLNFLTTSYH